MFKRRREQDSDQPRKRLRTRDARTVDSLSRLSNELLLHIFSFLPVSSLNVCQRLSHRFHALGGDSELWKRQYYLEWVRPRTRRLSNVRRPTLPAKTDYSPKVATWFDHGQLAQEAQTNWKRQYRLRHNWSRGSCRFTEVEFPQPPCPSTLVRFCAGVVFTVDPVNGLRVWTARDPASCMATASLTAYSKSPPVVPTALAISQLQDEIQISVGLENGRFSLFVWNIGTSDLRFQSSHMCCNDGAITAMALSSPYLLIVSQHKDLTLYDLCHGSQRAGKAGDIQEPHQLASLRAENIVAPMTLSLRVSSFDLVATIVYSFFHIGCGWSLGIQELRLGKDGQQLDSRLTTTVDSQYGLRPPRALSQSQERWYSATQPMNNQSLVSETPAILHQKPPTSMSYSHPYLLTSHADNTLTMYLVVSTSDKLFVQGGRRLWGHTSSVSAVQVTNRGKAVSVSARGDEIRIWELEMAISTLGSRKCFKEENGVQLNPENKQDEGSEIAPVHHNLDNVDHNQGLLQNCVGFDEERVLLLRDKTGTQLLGCYDFT